MSKPLMSRATFDRLMDHPLAPTEAEVRAAWTVVDDARYEVHLASRVAVGVMYGLCGLLVCLLTLMAMIALPGCVPGQDLPSMVQDFEADTARPVHQSVTLVPHGPAGQCYLPGVELDQEYWDCASDSLRRAVLYHELGHCVLGRQHTGWRTLEGLPASYMWPIVNHRAFNDAALTTYYREEIGND